MASSSVREVLESNLMGLTEDILEYLITIIEDMSIDERKSIISLKDTVIPFLLDTGYCENEEVFHPNISLKYHSLH